MLFVYCIASECSTTCILTSNNTLSTHSQIGFVKTGRWRFWDRKNAETRVVWARYFALFQKISRYSWLTYLLCIPGRITQVRCTELPIRSTHSLLGVEHRAQYGRPNRGSSCWSASDRSNGNCQFGRLAEPPSGQGSLGCRHSQL